MTLWDLLPKASAVLKGFKDEAAERYVARLRELGFEQGSEVVCTKVLPFGGPRIYQVGDSIFTIEHELARQILIQVES